MVIACWKTQETAFQRDYIPGNEAFRILGTEERKKKGSSGCRVSHLLLKSQNYWIVQLGMNPKDFPLKKFPFSHPEEFTHRLLALLILYFCQAVQLGNLLRELGGGFCLPLLNLIFQVFQLWKQKELMSSWEPAAYPKSKHGLPALSFSPSLLRCKQRSSGMGNTTRNSWRGICHRRSSPFSLNPYQLFAEFLKKSEG